MVEVRQATLADGPAICATLQRAFVEDPFVDWIVGPAERARSRYFRMVFYRLTAPHGAVYTTAGPEQGVAGAALWAPPGAWELSLGAQLRLLPDVVRVLGLRRLLTVGLDAAVIEEDRPLEPYYYLALLGTDPAHRGRGIASALMEPALARCDVEGTLAVLDTSVDRNVGFYARWGFEVVRTLRLPRDGPRVFTMQRLPRPPG